MFISIGIISGSDPVCSQERVQTLFFEKYWRILYLYTQVMKIGSSVLCVVITQINECNLLVEQMSANINIYGTKIGNK